MLQTHPLRKNPKYPTEITDVHITGCRVRFRITAHATIPISTTSNVKSTAIHRVSRGTGYVKAGY